MEKWLDVHSGNCSLGTFWRPDPGDQEGRAAGRFPSRGHYTGWLKSTYLEWVPLHLLYGSCGTGLSEEKGVNIWHLREHIRDLAERFENVLVILKLKHVLKAHKVGLKCQKFPFWTGFKATRAQTLTHRTISLLTYMVPNIFEAWKK